VLGVEQDKRGGGDRADPPRTQAYPAQGFEGGLEQAVPALGHRAGGGVQHVDGALGDGEPGALGGLLDRAHQPVGLAEVAQVNQHHTVTVAAALSLGTYAGGWRIIRTLGRRIVHLDPARGFAAETTAASVLYVTAFVYEVPVSTTHTITSAVLGSGATPRLSAVRWGVAGDILTAWVLTIPGAGAVAALTYHLHLVIPA
jgi:phosphate/sulfate permease